jgi:hypothetical protein
MGSGLAVRAANGPGAAGRPRRWCCTRLAHQPAVAGPGACTPCWPWAVACSSSR